MYAYEGDTTMLKKISLLAVCCVVVTASVVSQQIKGRSKAGSFEAPHTLVKDTTAPQIEVYEPVVAATRGLTTRSDTSRIRTNSSSLVVKGIAKDESGIARVLVNTREAHLTSSSEGTNFEREALLTLGDNSIEIVAVDRYENVSRLVIPVIREATMAEAKKSSPRDLFKGQRWAVIVGVSDYRDQSIPDLRYADRDARAFYDFLTLPFEEGGGGLPKPNVRLMINENATAANVREALTEFLKSAIEDDIVLIYFAGHGAPDPDRPKVLYLLTHDSELGRLGATAIKMQEIQDALRDYVAAKTVLVFADACHSRGVSGAVATRALAPPDLVNQFLSDLGRSRPSTLTLSASDIDQLSQEDKKWGGGHGVFTYFLLEGLKGKADSDNDRIVRLGELIFYVNDNVRRETRAQQSPISSGMFDVNLPLTIVVEQR